MVPMISTLMGVAVGPPYERTPHSTMLVRGGIFGWFFDPYVPSILCVLYVAGLGVGDSGCRLEVMPPKDGERGI